MPVPRRDITFGEFSKDFFSWIGRWATDKKVEGRRIGERYCLECTYFRCRKQGLTIRSTIDFIIAETAIENDITLLHNDSDLTSMAKIIKELKIY